MGRKQSECVFSVLMWFLMLEIEKIRKEGKRIGFTCSTFDLLHAGHTSMLAESKSKCDYLIVGLQTDPTIDRSQTKNKPIQSIEERTIQLKAVKYIDKAVSKNLIHKNTGSRRKSQITRHLNSLK